MATTIVRGLYMACHLFVLLVVSIQLKNLSIYGQNQ